MVRIRLRVMTAVAAIAAVALASCAATPPPRPAFQPESPPSPVAAPLKLCPDIPGAPANIASQPGYTEFAVAVIDSSGKSLDGLAQSDFTVTAPGGVPVAYFRDQNGAAPVSIAIVIDASGSMEAKLPTVESAFSKLLLNLNPCDEITIIAFGAYFSDPAAKPDLHYLHVPSASKMMTLQPWTTDHGLAASQLAHLGAYGQTPLYDAIGLAQDALTHASYRERMLIVVTDGIDNTSIATESVVIENDRGIPIFAIGIGDPLGSVAIGPFVIGRDDSERVDAASLTRIAAATGGQQFIVPPMSKDGGHAFVTALSSIADRLGHGYTIGVVMAQGVAWNGASPPQMAVANHPGASVAAQVVHATPAHP